MREISWLLLPAFLLVAVITALDGPTPDLSLDVKGQNLLPNQIERADNAAREHAYYGRNSEHGHRDAPALTFSIDLDERFESLQLFIDSIQNEVEGIHQAARRLAAATRQALEDA